MATLLSGTAKTVKLEGIQGIKVCGGILLKPTEDWCGRLSIYN